MMSRYNGTHLHTGTQLLQTYCFFCQDLNEIKKNITAEQFSWNDFFFKFIFMGGELGNQFLSITVATKYRIIAESSLIISE